MDDQTGFKVARWSFGGAILARAPHAFSPKLFTSPAILESFQVNLIKDGQL